MMRAWRLPHEVYVHERTFCFQCRGATQPQRAADAPISVVLLCWHRPGAPLTLVVGTAFDSGGCMTTEYLEPAVKVFTVLATVSGGLFAVIKWLQETARQRELRGRQLRWDQAKAAKELLDDLSQATLAQQAMQMMDWDDLTYTLPSGKTVRIDEDLYVKALRVTNLQFSDAEVFVRNAFDELFYHMAVFAHHVNTGLVRIEDIQFPLDYYMPTINRNRHTFDAFLEHYRLVRAASFLELMDKHLGPAAAAVPRWRDLEKSP
jgi:hypothetical protein